jgi:hypothetical protein
MNEEPRTLDEIKEQLAAIEHTRWSDWQKYMHSKLEYGKDNDGNVVMFIPTGLLNHWESQIATPYDQLTESEKDSDREQVDRYLPIIEALIKQAELRGELEGFKYAAECEAMADWDTLENYPKELQTQLEQLEKGQHD